MMISWEWEPNVSVGPVRLGDDINSYVHSLGAFKEDLPEIGGWVTYKIPDTETYIETENGKIVAIELHEELLYKHINIIGINISELENLLCCNASAIGDSVEYADGDVQTPYECFDVGLQIWTSNGVIVSASCASYLEV